MRSLFKAITVTTLSSTLVATLSACQTTHPPIATAPRVDLARFMGDWYVIANIPTFIERGAHNAVESYRLDQDGTIHTTFTFNKDGFDGPRKQYNPRGFVRDTQSNAVWGMQFVWPIKADYRIVYVSDAYDRTIIGRQARDYVWIMARTPKVAEAEYQAMLEIVERQGYDISKVRRVPQRWGGGAMWAQSKRLLLAWFDNQALPASGELDRRIEWLRTQPPINFMFRSTYICAAVILGAITASNYLWLGAVNAIQQEGQNRALTKTTQLAPAPMSQVNSFLRLLEKNQEVVVYGGIASIGILMMGIAIGSASATPKSKNSAQLEALKQEKEKAENLAKLKAEFLNQVSHELRTPLAVIIGYIECITDGLYGDLENKHQEILQVVAKQSSHLKHTIDQILIYSRLEAAKQPLRIDDLPLNKLIADMRETFDFLCRQKGLELHWELPHSPIEINTGRTGNT